MLQKKVLVHGSLKSLADFFSSPFNREFEPLALVTDEIEKVSPDVRSTGGGTLPEIFSTEKIPRFTFRFIDGIVLTDFASRDEIIHRLLKLGLEPQKIILWNNRGAIEFFDMPAKDGSTFVFMEGLQFHIRKEDDINFFKGIHWWLQNQRQFYAINPKYYPAYIAQLYNKHFGKTLDWNNLQTWTEKIQWIRLYDSTPIKTLLADKYLVRQWVAEKIGQEYIIPLLGVWNNFDEINFDLLPNQFVLKCNHGSGMDIICRDKNNFDFEEAQQKLTAWLQIDYGTTAFEPHYSDIPRKIIAEKFMSDGKNFGLRDYKFWCFDGKPFCCIRETRDPKNWFASDYFMDYFDMDWNHLEIEQPNHPNSDHPEKILKPKNFELMKKFAAELGKGFANARVDFYEIGDNFYFSEITFIHDAGFRRYSTKGTDEVLGNLLTLPKEKYLFWEK